MQRLKQEKTRVTFDSDLDDVVCSAQVVCGRTAVVPTVVFIHIRNFERFLEVIEGHPAARELSSILLPRDLWSGSVTEANTRGCVFVCRFCILFFCAVKYFVYHVYMNTMAASYKAPQRVHSFCVDYSYS